MNVHAQDETLLAYLKPPPKGSGGRFEAAETNGSSRRPPVDHDFLRVLAHELRTPLTSLRVSADLLAERQLFTARTESATRIVSNIQRSVARLESRLTEVLEAGYLASGLLSIAPKSIHIMDIVAPALEDAAVPARARDVTLELMAEESVQGVRADAGRIQQVLGHLLSNAVKFAPVGSAVAIRVFASPAGGPARIVRQYDSTDDLGPATLITPHLGASPSACVTVRDSGPGIHPSVHKKIFDAFSGGSADGAPTAGGAGLGLSLALGLIKLHRGALWVRSRVKIGSEFGFSLPAAAPAEDTL